MRERTETEKGGKSFGVSVTEETRSVKRFMKIVKIRDLYV